jgi:hypothetical protein
MPELAVRLVAEPEHRANRVLYALPPGYSQPRNDYIDKAAAATVN